MDETAELRERIATLEADNGRLQAALQALVYQAEKVGQMDDDLRRALDHAQRVLTTLVPPPPDA